MRSDKNKWLTGGDETPCKQPSQSTSLHNFSLSRNCQEPNWHFLLTPPHLPPLNRALLLGSGLYQIVWRSWLRSFLHGFSVVKVYAVVFWGKFMFSVPWIVTQLCMLTNKRNFFLIIGLIHFFLSSTCSRLLMFINRKTIECPNKSARFNFVLKRTIYSKRADIFISV